MGYNNFQKSGAKTQRNSKEVRINSGWFREWDFNCLCAVKTVIGGDRGTT